MNYRVEAHLVPALPSSNGTGPCVPRTWLLEIDADNEEQAHRIAVDRIKAAVKHWGGTARVMWPRLKIGPVTPAVIPQPWLRAPKH